MRWQVSLQLAIGLGALFGLAYYGVERFLGPPLEWSAIDSADTHAVVGASEIASNWEKTRAGRRALVRALAGSPTFREKSSEQVEAALESAAAQMGGGVAALIRTNGEKVAGIGDSPEALARLETTHDAHRGLAIVRFEKIGTVLHIVSAAPVESADGRTWAALVLASKLAEPQIHKWMVGIPEDASAALMDGDQVVASTIPRDSTKKADPASRELLVEKSRFRTARRALVDDVGTKLTVVGAASIKPAADSEVMERVRLLVLALGGLSLILALVVVMIAPSDSAQDIMQEFNQASRDLPHVQDTGPLDPIDLSPEPALEHPYYPPPPPPTPAPRSRPAAKPESPPLHSPAPSFSSPGFGAPSLESVTHPQGKRERTPSDTRLALDAENAIPKTPSPPPRPAPTQPPSRSSAGLPPHPADRFGAPEPIPLPGGSGRPAHAPERNSMPPSRGGAMPPPASPFDQITAAAFAPPPPPPPKRTGPKDDDLLMPKGADLDLIAREAAKQGPPKYEPSDLPGLRGSGHPVLPPHSPHPGDRSPFSPPPPSPPPPSMSQSGGFSPMQSGRTPSRPSDLPGLRADDPAQRAFDGPGSSAPRRGSDPWSNPALGVYSTTPPVQERLSVSDRPISNPTVRQAPSAPASPSSPIAFDEEHYRVVFNDFVASKARLGEAVDNITYEGFRSKLRSSEEALINRHGCRAVRFQVLVKDNTVSLRPQLVR